MPYTVNASILLTDLPLLERPAAAKAAGFDAVEFWWPFAEAVPADAEVDRFVRAIEDAGVQLTGLNFFAGDMPAGDRGLVSWKGRCGEFKDNIDVVVGIGERLGTRAFNALYGNRLDDFTPEAQDELGLKNLVAAAEGVAKIGGTVLLEPVSGTPAYPLKTAQDALDVIARAGQSNIKLLADFYHLAVNGDDVAAVIEAHAADFGHIQIADSPGRNEPGTGELPLAQWIARSQELGYAGHIGLEYKASQDDPFAWLSTFG
ncbi:hydroxypyruvate isomerase family protein [Leucobacter chromiireducens]|uniref:Hydroxypyruvate isomerase n=1 Tax=Leucobacter chromiireducens subsp. solipictus TaxID=398235 RepID=A0ABS1SGN0_9MICO|nr:TIM barrel protein [Leucobacter chromiireducens]MBL3678438.1 hydroxypyruvate isomerase [Leucobacter chromiireducens subsp. solipictus]